MRLKLIVFLFFLYIKTDYAQLIIDTSLTPNNLVKKVLIGSSSGLMVKNITYSGAKESIGFFNINLKHNSLIKKGIIISTGNVFNAIDPNTVPNKSSKSSNYGDNDLNNIVNTNTFDAAVLEFDFVSLTDSISFNFFFASEEYPEYVNKNVNDVFGFFIINDELSIKKNIALMQPDNIPVSIDNINSVKNSKYFIKNGIWDNNNIEKWEANMQQGELAYTFQYDGLTTLLHVGSNVIPNTYYRLKLAIADAGDSNYDSAIFLEAKSFKSSGSYEELSALPNDLIAKELNKKVIVNSDSSISVNFNIEFESDKIIGADSYKFLQNVYNILNYNKMLIIEVYGYTDNTGTKKYNQQLSEKRAENISAYLVNQGIKAGRIKTLGLGYSNPISNSNMQLNRRVEFRFKK